MKKATIIMISIAAVAVIAVVVILIISPKSAEKTDSSVSQTDEISSETVSESEISSEESSEETEDSSASSETNGTSTENSKKTSQSANTNSDKTKQQANNEKNTEKSNGLTYIGGILIANKTYSLPSDYAPGVDSTAQAALNRMESAAADEGIDLYIVSGYRSYDYQAQIYNDYVRRDGKAEADTYSARPGHSEHQTGLAFDLNSLSTSFENTSEGRWLAQNCYKYGFIIRYPKGKESVTGYQYEPWHVRYLGVETATKVYNSGLCLEEYLGITSRYQ